MSKKTSPNFSTLRSNTILSEPPTVQRKTLMDHPPSHNTGHLVAHQPSHQAWLLTPTSFKHDTWWTTHPPSGKWPTHQTGFFVLLSTLVEQKKLNIEQLYNENSCRQPCTSNDRGIHPTGTIRGNGRTGSRHSTAKSGAPAGGVLPSVTKDLILPFLPLNGSIYSIEPFESRQAFTAEEVWTTGRTSSDCRGWHYLLPAHSFKCTKSVLWFLQRSQIALTWNLIVAINKYGAGIVLWRLELDWGSGTFCIRLRVFSRKPISKMLKPLFHCKLF